MNWNLSGERDGTRWWKRLACAWLSLPMLCAALGSISLAQESEEHSGRKTVHTQKPEYPAVLKSKGITGIVRLNARVLANGTVANVEVLGGNPILAESATKALMTWKYTPGASASNEIVTFTFNAH